MPRYRIVFMGSPDFAILALQTLAKKHDICAVYTQPAKPGGRGMKPTPVPVAAYAANMSMALFSPASLKPDDVQQQLAAHNADLFVVVAYGLLLPNTVLSLPKLGCINGHASLLPRWRGAAPIQRALAAGDTKTGISAMLMDEGLDTGKVLMRRSCRIDPTETAGSLHDKLATMNAETLDEVVWDIVNLLATAETQDDSQALYAAKISPQEAEINWALDTAKLDHHIRAFTPFPGAWCHGPKGRLLILRARPTDVMRPAGALAGSIAGVSKAVLHVTTGDGVMEIEKLQPAGKKPMHVADFLNGHKLFAGQMLAEAIT
ncbi:MAG: methionyl-tRNA formyltransferase [Pseudomonadota bacterium]|nr:methionyl-tRNA formyltransferase [Pseudomonadota bacterium]